MVLGQGEVVNVRVEKAQVGVVQNVYGPDVRLFLVNEEREWHYGDVGRVREDDMGVGVFQAGNRSLHELLLIIIRKSG